MLAEKKRVEVEAVERRQLSIILLLAFIIHLMVLVPLLVQLFGPAIDLQKMLEEKKELVELQKEQAALQPKEALVIPEQVPMQQPQPQVEGSVEETPEQTTPLKQIEPLPEKLPFSEAPGIPEPTPEKETKQKEQRKPQKKKVRKVPRVIGPAENRAILPNFNQNFVNYMQEGEDEYKRKGNENIRPDLEEMKLISYNKKILQFINGASGMLRDKLTQALRENKTVRDLILNFSIGKDGNLLNLETIQSSGSTEIDSIFKALFKSAAPFPNPPAHLNGKPFTMQCCLIKEIMDYAKYNGVSLSFQIIEQ